MRPIFLRDVGVRFLLRLPVESFAHNDGYPGSTPYMHLMLPRHLSPNLFTDLPAPTLPHSWVWIKQFSCTVSLQVRDEKFLAFALRRSLRLPQNNAAKEQQAGGGGGAAGGGFPQLRSLFSLMSDVLGDPRKRQQLGPVLDQLGEFAREVCGWLVDGLKCPFHYSAGEGGHGSPLAEAELSQLRSLLL